jgi:hypothetical protein
MRVLVSNVSKGSHLPSLPVISVLLSSVILFVEGSDTDWLKIRGLRGSLVL